MNEPAVNPWTGKTAEDVLAESCHQIRNPVSLVAGYLHVLKSAGQLALSAEQVQEYIELALRYAVEAQDIVDSVYRYINERGKET